MAGHRVLLLLLLSVVRAEGHSTCPGVIAVGGHGPVRVTSTKWNMPGDPAGPVDVVAGKVVPHMKGRAYFAGACSEGQFNHTSYSSMKLLGKRLRYTTDISGAGCGCNAAFYLVAMAHNAELSGCDDHYCDANSVCGPNCAEIDVQEANRFAWHSALHKAYDRNGVAGGYGGWTQGATYPFDSAQYGPGSKCIDTSAPFDVAVSFHATGGTLKAMEVTLSQPGRTCPLSVHMGEYPGMAELGAALSAGMTPVVSYWSSPDMAWLDGPGMGKGPCQSPYGQPKCSAAPQFYGFALEDL